MEASLFLRNIGEHAAQKGYLTLLLRSYYVSRDQIICANADLIPLIRQHFSATADAANPLIAVDIQNPPDPPFPASRDAAYNPTTADNKLYTASPELFLSRSAMHCQEIIAATDSPPMRRLFDPGLLQVMDQQDGITFATDEAETEAMGREMAEQEEVTA